MYSIASDELTVNILDPKKDRERFGLRYCTGGYIFEVMDNATGKNLMTGPTYPYDFQPFHGQGIPDTFNHDPLYLPEEDLFLIPGIGKCDIKNNEIVELCKWNLALSTDEKSMIFTTRQQAGPYDFTIVRKVSVEGSTITSNTRLKNNCNTLVPVEWYPHPFFPPKEDGRFLSVDVDSYFENPTGYFEIEDGKIRRIFGVDQELSFQPVRPGDNPMLATIHTDHGYSCTMKTDYMSQYTPIWANDNTCSIEPYLSTTLYGYGYLEWSVSYSYSFS